MAEGVPTNNQRNPLFCETIYHLIMHVVPDIGANYCNTYKVSFKAASPACTELETIVLDWFGKYIMYYSVPLHDVWCIWLVW